MKQRIITAVVAALFFIPFVIYGKVPFTVLVYLMAFIGLYEMFRMRGFSLFSIEGILGLITVAAILMPKSFEQTIQDATTFNKMEFIIITSILLLIYVVLKKNKFTFDDAAFIILSALYVGIGFFYFIETRSAGLEYIIFALIIVWATDSGAYFTGRKLGKNKLWPEISPNKTVEGFVGGIIIAIICTSIMQIIYPFDKNWLVIILITIISSIFGQMGDLVESAIKRHYGVKDSGKLLPGHGGILDRFDSLLFVLPLLNLLHFVS